MTRTSRKQFPGGRPKKVDVAYSKRLVESKAEIITSARNALAQIRPENSKGGLKPPQKKEEMRETRQRSRDAHAQRRKTLKSTPILKHPADKKIINLWKKLKNKVRNKAHFYVLAIDTLKLPRDVIEIRFRKLESEGLITIENGLTQTGKKAKVKVSTTPLEDRSKIPLAPNQKTIIKKSKFTKMHITKLGEEIRRITREKPRNAKELLDEAMLVYRARTGAPIKEFIALAKNK